MFRVLAFLASLSATALAQTAADVPFTFSVHVATQDTKLKQELTNAFTAQLSRLKGVTVVAPNEESEYEVQIAVQSKTTGQPIPLGIVFAMKLPQKFVDEFHRTTPAWLVDELKPFRLILFHAVSLVPRSDFGKFAQAYAQSFDENHLTLIREMLERLKAQKP
jgi:hypothetical protein